jgi:hypothetical protein
MSMWRATRRRWMKRTGMAFAACATGVVTDTFWIEPHWLEIVRRELPIAGLPPHWQGKMLAQVSGVRSRAV